MDDFIAYTSRWRTCLYGMISLAFVAVGAWMVGVFGQPPVASRASSEMVVLWGWITIAFFGLGALVTAKLWWRNSEQLRIGQAGVRWSRWCDQTIPWSEISDVSEWRYKTTRSIILHLRNPSLFPGRGLMGFAGRANKALTGGDIGVSLAGTDRKYDEAMAAIAHFRPAQ